MGFVAKKRPPLCNYAHNPYVKVTTYCPPLCYFL